MDQDEDQVDQGEDQVDQDEAWEEPAWCAGTAECEGACAEEWSSEAQCWLRPGPALSR